MKPKELLQFQKFEKNLKVPGIYMIYNTKTEKCYIGSAFSISRRWSSHKASLNNVKHANSHLQNAWSKDKENFQFIVLELIPKEKLEERENYYLTNIDGEFLYNICPVSKSKKLSEETKRKISEAHKGKTISPETIKKIVERKKERGTGKHTEESKKKLSEAHKGKFKKKGYKQTEEHKRKIREKKLGIKRSQESRKKMSKSHTGVKLNPEHVRSLKEALQKSWDERRKNGYMESEKYLETKRKISKAHKGKKLSEEHRKKMSETRKGRKSWNKGRKLSLNHLVNVRISIFKDKCIIIYLNNLKQKNNYKLKEIEDKIIELKLTHSCPLCNS